MSEHTDPDEMPEHVDELEQLFRAPDSEGNLSTTFGEIELAEGLADLERLCEVLAHQGDMRYSLTSLSPPDSRGYRVSIEQEVEIDPIHVQQIQEIGLAQAEEIAATITRMDVSMVDDTGAALAAIFYDGDHFVPFEYLADLSDFPVPDIDDTSIHMFELCAAVRQLPEFLADDEHDADDENPMATVVSTALKHMDVAPASFLEISETVEQQHGGISFQFYQADILDNHGEIPPTASRRQLVVLDYVKSTRYTINYSYGGTLTLRAYEFDDQSNLTPIGNHQEAIDIDQLEQMLDSLEDLFGATRQD